jgi:hypothetical protein
MDFPREFFAVPADRKAALFSSGNGAFNTH